MGAVSTGTADPSASIPSPSAGKPTQGRSTSAKNVRKAAEAAASAAKPIKLDFDVLMAKAMASAKAYQDAWRSRARVHTEREQICPWRDYLTAQWNAGEAVALPAVLYVEGSPWVGSAGSIVAMLRLNRDGFEERVELGADSGKTKLTTRSAIMSTAPRRR